MHYDLILVIQQINQLLNLAVVGNSIQSNPVVMMSSDQRVISNVALYSLVALLTHLHLSTGIKMAKTSPCTQGTIH